MASLLLRTSSSLRFFISYNACSMLFFGLFAHHSISRASIIIDAYQVFKKKRHFKYHMISLIPFFFYAPPRIIRIHCVFMKFTVCWCPYSLSCCLSSIWRLWLNSNSPPWDFHFHPSNVGAITRDAKNTNSIFDECNKKNIAKMRYKHVTHTYIFDKFGNFFIRFVQL